MLIGPQGEGNICVTQAPADELWVGALHDQEAPAGAAEDVQAVVGDTGGLADGSDGWIDAPRVQVPFLAHTQTRCRD
jgi:hypothetical protein